MEKLIHCPKCGSPVTRFLHEIKDLEQGKIIQALHCRGCGILLEIYADLSVREKQNAK